MLRDALEARGLFGAVFCAPATPKNRSLIRFTVNSGLEQDTLDRIIEVCADIRDEVAFQDWPSTRRRRATPPCTSSRPQRPDWSPKYDPDPCSDA